MRGVEARRPWLRDGVVAGSTAAIVSGAPSTLHALVTGGDVLEATRAAGSLLLWSERRSGRLLVAGAVVHVALSLGWGAVLGAALPRTKTTMWGAVAGLGIAALDLGVVGRRNARIRALPPLPQVLDHIAYGLVAGFVLQRDRSR